MSGLMQAAQIAGAVTAILACITVVGRFLLRFSLFARFLSWVREGYQRDREERIVVVLQEYLPEILDKTMAFNGTGSFRKDMRIFYETTTTFMQESSADRAALHVKVDRIQGEVE